MKGINLIAAVSIDGKIGHDQGMLWYFQEDMDFYKKMTTGNILIVGPKTYYGLPEQALRNRTHIIVIPEGDTRTIENKFNADIYVTAGPVKTIKRVQEIVKDNQKIFVIGGETIYKELLPYVQTAHITWINKIYESGNRNFPIDELHKDFYISDDKDWRRTKDGRRYKFVTYERTF
jgi:dihydrofolate reductase